jgi:hypothetical protein
VLVRGARSGDAIELARQLVAEDHSIHFHTFLPKDIVALVRWMHQHVTPVEIADGPVMSRDADEFHVMLRKP